MKKFILIIALTLLGNLTFAQNKWFTLYTDSTALVSDANEIRDLFVADIKNIRPEINFKPDILLNTTPYLIYYSFDGKVNLPFWEQVIPDLKKVMKQMVKKYSAYFLTAFICHTNWDMDFKTL